VRRHARNREALARARSFLEILSVPPFRIGHDRLPPHFVKCNILRGVPRRGRNRNGRKDAILEAVGPFQHMHSAHGAADDAEQVPDAELLHQHRFGPHHVRDGNDREIEPVGLFRRRICRRRPGGPHAAPYMIGANHVQPVGVDRLSGADHRLPPAGLACHRVLVGHVLIPGQRMCNEHGVGSLRVQLAVCLVGQRERRKRHAAVELERLVRAKCHL
jgi:hypothetical protein